MEYKYITENNLFEKQTYMYSEYKGIDFIKEYMSSRKNWQCIKNETGGMQNEKYIAQCIMIWLEFVKS